MERLTKLDGIGQNEIIKCFGCDLEKAGAELEHCGYCERWQAVVNRLAAYEDTGLEPEDADQIRKAAEYMMFEAVGDFVRLAISNFDDLQAYRALGAVEELSALVKARDEGRVLPEKSMWTTTCKGRKLVLVMDVKAAHEAEVAIGGGGND